MPDLIRVQPVVDGLLNGFGLASRLRQAALQQADFDERKRARAAEEKRADARLQLDRDRIADERAERTRTHKRQEAADARQRTSDDLKLANDPSLVPLQPGQTDRPTIPMQTGNLSERLRLFAPNSVELPAFQRTITANGQNYGVKGQSEQLEDRLAQARSLMGFELEKTAALDQIKNPMISVQGYPGTVPRASTNAAINAVTRGADRTAANQRASARNATTLSAAQLRASAGAKPDDQKRKDDLDALVKEERGLQERVLSLRKAVLTGKLPMKNDAGVVELTTLDAETQESYKADLKLAEDQLKEIRGRKVSRGFSSEEDVTPRGGTKKKAAPARRPVSGGRNPYR